MKKSWLIDSNVLVYSYDETVKQHDLSYYIVEKAMSGEISACLAQQNLLEFISVVTNPKRVLNPLSTDEALEKINSYISSNIRIISPLPTTIFTFHYLIQIYPAIRERIFDVYLAATAFDNNVGRICTFNIRHLKNILSLEVKTPEEVILLESE